MQDEIHQDYELSVVVGSIQICMSFQKPNAPNFSGTENEAAHYGFVQILKNLSQNVFPRI
jgi:hypothetical protein